ncbi:MAG: hypothetical protein GY822_12485 [Deltaproteobacteria bacterium]|nr:hypothetical protein [Deltaproteobacteria bacterium]
MMQISYRIRDVTDHDGKLYLTTDKVTTLFWIFPISAEQAITQCKAVANEQPTLDCKEVSVVIDGSEWDQ